MILLRPIGVKPAGEIPAPEELPDGPFYGHDLSGEYTSPPDAEKTREPRGKRLVEKIPACGRESNTNVCDNRNNIIINNYKYNYL